MAVSILSPEKEIDDLWIETKRISLIKGEKIDKIVMKGQYVIIRFKDGKLWTNRIRQKSAAFMLGRWPWLDDMGQLLIKLGVVSKEAFERHKAAVEKYEEEREFKSDVEEYKRLMRKHGTALRPLKTAAAKPSPRK